MIKAYKKNLQKRIVVSMIVAVMLICSMMPVISYAAVNVSATLENSMHTIQQTLSAMKALQASGTLTNNELQQLSNRLTELQKAVDAETAPLTENVVADIVKYMQEAQVYADMTTALQFSVMLNTSIIMLNNSIAQNAKVGTPAPAPSTKVIEVYAAPLVKSTTPQRDETGLSSEVVDLTNPEVMSPFKAPANYDSMTDAKKLEVTMDYRLQGYKALHDYVTTHANTLSKADITQIRNYLTFYVDNMGKYTNIPRQSDILGEINKTLAELSKIETSQNAAVQSGTITVISSTAAGLKTFSDIQNHWAKSSIEALASKGAISGINATQFAPQSTVTYAQYLKIAYCAVNGPQPASPKGEHWAATVFDAAIASGVITPNQIPRAMWDKPITRYDMTVILISIAEKLQGETAVNTDAAAKLMGDYAEVAKQGSKSYYVEQAYMKGLMAGVDAKGTFAGAKTGTRAEAAAMIIRLIESSKRVNVVIPDVAKPGTVSKVLNETDIHRGIARPGDTFVRKDGTKVVLKIGPSGVLGEAQGCNLYGGITYANGGVIKDGSLLGSDLGYGGETYLVDTKTGEGHSSAEWESIRTYWGLLANNQYRGKDVQDGTKVGLWVVYSADIGMFTWSGPVNQ